MLHVMKASIGKQLTAPQQVVPVASFFSYYEQRFNNIILRLMSGKGRGEGGGGVCRLGRERVAGREVAGAQDGERGLGRGGGGRAGGRG